MNCTHARYVCTHARDVYVYAYPYTYSSTPCTCRLQVRDLSHTHLRVFTRIYAYVTSSYVICHIILCHMSHHLMSYVTCVSSLAFTCVWTHVCAGVCAYIFDACAWTRVCVCVCVCVCVGVGVRAYTAHSNCRNASVHACMYASLMLVI